MPKEEIEHGFFILGSRGHRRGSGNTLENFRRTSKDTFLEIVPGAFSRFSKDSHHPKGQLHEVLKLEKTIWESRVGNTRDSGGRGACIQVILSEQPLNTGQATITLKDSAVICNLHGCHRN